MLVFTGVWIIVTLLGYGIFLLANHQINSGAFLAIALVAIAAGSVVANITQLNRIGASFGKNQNFSFDIQKKVDEVTAKATEVQALRDEVKGLADQARQSQAKADEARTRVDDAERRIVQLAKDVNKTAESGRLMVKTYVEVAYLEFWTREIHPLPPQAQTGLLDRLQRLAALIEPDEKKRIDWIVGEIDPIAHPRPPRK